MNMEYKQKPIISAIYYNYKGGHYRVITLAPHTETGEDLVICQSIEFGGFQARPLSQWFDEVTDHRGNKCKRFEYKFPQ